MPFKIAIPYWVFVDGHPLGIMRSSEVKIQMPPGEYTVGVKIILQLLKWQTSIGGEKHICLSEGQHLHLSITDKDRWWNWLFNIDLVLWLASLFFTLPHPYHIVYEVLSNGFFIVWLIRLYIVRNRYFSLVQTTPDSDK